MMDANESVRLGVTPSRNLLLLLAVALGLMGTQLVLPFGGVPAADAVAGLAFLAVLYYLWRGVGEVAVPAPLPAVLIAYALANLAARSHLPGAVEVVQRVVYLFCGTAMLGLLLKHRPHWVLWAVGTALAASLAVALVQGFRFGFGSTLPPKDVAELAAGFGGAFTGLFRSRLALGLFVGLALVWLQPFAYQLAKGWKSWCAILLGTAVVLGFVAHGQLLLVVAAAAVYFGFIHSRKAGLANLGALILLALSLLVGGRGAVLADSLSPLADRYGALKPGHLELIPAFRLANEHPLHGVGAGSAYQRRIGAAYRLLPRENVNDMEADSQAGYGILFATVGYPAGFLMVALLLWGVGLGVRGFLTGVGDPRQLGGGALLAVVLGAMWITDPFTKGNSWFVALGLASAWSAGALLTLNLKRLLAWGAVFALLAGLIVLAGKSTDSGTMPPPPPRARANWSNSSFASQGFLRVLDAGDAKEIGKPMRKESDSQAAKGTILHVPDNSGVPPSEAAAGLAHGGARFELDAPEDLECMVWVRVLWNGSCGNSVFVKVGDDGHPMRVGDDGTYDVWHWVAAPDVVRLAKGTNRIYLLNREDGIRFDQMLITDDLSYHPQGIEEENE